MKVTHELTDDLNGVISINLETADYQPQIEKTLKDYRKKANMPGFRPGMVPMGMIKKMYGNSVLGEELNKILSEQLNTYITSNDLQVLGNPLPKEDDKIDLDINKLEAVTFNYNIGIAPAFEVKISDKDKFTYNKVAIDQDLIEKYSSDIRRRYGKVEEVEAAGENDMLSGKFQQLDAEGAILENGIEHTSTITLEFLEDEAAKKELTGKKVGDVVVVDPFKVSKGHEDLGKMLNISHEQVHAIEGQKFQFSVEHVYHMTPAELTQELYDTVYGKDEVKTEEEYNARISAELTDMFAKDSDFLLMRNVQDELIEKLKLPLPDEFLKRWLMNANEKPLTPEQLEAEYPNYAKGLMWQLIENKLISGNDLNVGEQEVIEYVKDNLKAQFARYGMPDPEAEVLDQAVARTLQNQEEVRNVYQELYNRKLLALYKDTFKLKEKEVSFDEFVKLATGKPAKKGILSNIGNLFKG